MQRMSYRNEEARDLPFILEPGVPVLDATALDVADCSMDDHCCEEDGVEPRERAVESSDQSPAYSEDKIASIMDLARQAICTIREILWLAKSEREK